MATVTRYVDPDATPNGNDGTTWVKAYLSLNACEEAEDGGDHSGDDLIILCRASGGTADSTAVWPGGFTYDSVTIQAAATDRASKTGLDVSKYRLTNRLGTSDPLIFDGIQFANEAASTEAVKAEFSGAGTIIVKNCYFHIPDTVGMEAIYAKDSDTDFIVYNTIIYGVNNRDVGIRIESSNSFQIYNSIVYGTTDGILIDGNENDVTIKNVASFNNTDDFDDSDTSTIDYCASDDGDGDHPVAHAGADWDAEFTDPTNGDFTLLNSGNCYQGGADNPGSGLYTTDIEGDSYNSGAYSIGADEYPAEGGSIVPIILQQMRRRR